MEIKELIAPLKRWWWLILGAGLVAAAASFLATLQQAPTYMATTTLMIGGTINDPNLAATYKAQGADAIITDTYMEMDLGRFEKTMRLNVASGFFLTQRFARRWIERKVAGRVLFSGSINGRLAEPVSLGAVARASGVVGVRSP